VDDRGAAGYRNRSVGRQLGCSVNRALRRAAVSTYSSCGGHGKAGERLLSATYPCSAHHSAIESLTTSSLAETPALTQSAIPWRSSPNARAPGIVVIDFAGSGAV
jgi:hypothetical protein